WCAWPARRWNTTACRPTVWSSWAARSRFEALGLHLGAQPVDRRLGAALGVRNLQRAERGLDHAQRAQYHRRVDVAHMGDAEGLARQVADAVAEDDAAFLVGIGSDRLRIVAVDQYAGDGVGAFGGLDDVEADRLALAPHAHRAAHRLGQQVVAAM